MPEAITKYAVNRSLGTPDFLPLNEIIEKKVSVKTQHIVAEIPLASYPNNYATSRTTIEPIDVSKSIIIPTGYIPSQEGLSSISYDFEDSSTVRLTVRGNGNLGGNMSLTILTIGG
jgi:hypothetical protein